MTKRKIERLSVMYRKEIVWLKWYFLKDKEKFGQTILEQKIKTAMLSGDELEAKKYLVIKQATEKMIEITDDKLMKSIKDVFVYEYINVIGACRSILFFSPSQAYVHLNKWFEDYADMFFVFVPIEQP